MTIYKELKQVIRELKDIKEAGLLGRESRYSLLERDLFNKVSYRLPRENPRYIGIKVLFDLLKKIWSNKDGYKVCDDSVNSAIMGLGYQWKETEVDYIERQREKVGYFFVKEDLPYLCRGIREIFCITLRLLSFSFPHLIRSIFTNDETTRASNALIIQEVLQVACCIFVCKRKKIVRVYDFISYDKDSNFLAFVLQKNNILVVKIPPPSPLVTHHSFIIADNLIVSSEYQIEELNSGLINYSNGKIEKWLFGDAFNYIDKYSQTRHQPPKNTIGFYSHGSWVREKKNHIDDGLNIFKSELLLINDLCSFLLGNPSFTLKIFLHPKEKTKDIWEDTIKFYEQHFKGVEFNIANKSISSNLSFEECDIGVSTLSTIIFERLFCGYKTIIGKYETKKFPIETSLLNNICFSEGELESMVLEYSNFSREKFFEDLELMNYYYRSHPHFLS